MSLKSLTAALLQCVFLLMLASTNVLAHPFHTSAAEMEWNSETRCFEVSWKLDPNDLEQELRRRTKKRVFLEKLEQQDVVFDYMKEIFVVQVGNEQCAIKPVGIELAVKEMWIYFEVACPAGLDDIEIKNALLLNVHHQINTLVIKQRSESLAMTFHRDKQSQKLSWNSTSQTLKIDTPSEPLPASEN